MNCRPGCRKRADVSLSAIIWNLPKLKRLAPESPRREKRHEQKETAAAVSNLVTILVWICAFRHSNAVNPVCDYSAFAKSDPLASPRGLQVNFMHCVLRISTL